MCKAMCVSAYGWGELILIAPGFVILSRYVSVSVCVYEMLSIAFFLTPHRALPFCIEKSNKDGKEETNRKKAHNDKKNTNFFANLFSSCTLTNTVYL